MANEDMEKFSFVEVEEVVEEVVSEMENVHKISSGEEEEVKSEIEKLKVTSSEKEKEKEEYEIEDPFSDHPQDDPEEESDSDGEDLEQFAPSFMPYYGSKEVDYEHYKTDAYKAFSKIITLSRGFEVPPRPPNLRVNVGIVPTRDTKTMNRLASIAIEKCNKRYGKGYIFDRVIKGNKQLFQGIMYYITFVVVEEFDAECIWFEAKVCFRYKTISVIECHPKRSTPSYTADDPHLLCLV